MKALALLGVVFILIASAVCVYELQADPCETMSGLASVCAGGISHTPITSRVTLATVFLALGVALVLMALVGAHYTSQFRVVWHALRLYGEKPRAYIHFLTVLFSRGLLNARIP